MIVLAIPAVASAQYRRPAPYRDPDFSNWDKPLQATNPPEPEPEQHVTYGAIEVGTLTTGSLAPNETHYLQFRLGAASHCMLESEDPNEALQIAYLDETTRVAALGLYAELKPGAYFVRLRSRGPATYKLTLECAAQ